MSADALHSLALVAVITAATLLTRMLPFLIFGGKKEPPRLILYLGRVLPCAIMGMLVVYCLRSTDLTAPPYGAAEALGVLAAVLLHLWRRSSLLSIAGATVLYMVLVQAVF